MNNEMLKEIVAKYKDDIVYPYDEIFNIIGFDALVSISEIFSGSQIYIPKKKYLFSGCIEKQILTECKNYNYKTLAKKYDMCENTIRKIVNNSIIRESKNQRRNEK